MKDRPILFSGEMVRAILDGRKTQTRRVVKPQPVIATPSCFDELKCPYGQPGDLLWVRETWAAHGMYDDLPPSEARSERADLKASDNRWFRADGVCAPSQRGLPPGGMRGKWRPSILMPRWASRLTLEITGVRVERLQDISDEDAKAEGLAQVQFGNDLFWKCYCKMPVRGGGEYVAFRKPQDSFESLWESINGPGSWDANPWVWVINFNRVDAR